MLARIWAAAAVWGKPERSIRRRTTGISDINTTAVASFRPHKRRSSTVFTTGLAISSSAPAAIA